MMNPLGSAYSCSCPVRPARDDSRKPGVLRCKFIFGDSQGQGSGEGRRLHRTR
jgi:hypothetical protein